MKDEATGEERVVRWYVRAECGDVRGPMSREDAEFESGRLDGAIMFDERIFEPKFVTTEEVDTLLEDLKTVAGVWDDKPEGGIAERARDALILLCKKPKPEVNFSVAVLLSELQGLREAKEIIREGEDDAIGTMLKQVMAALISLSREEVVEIEVFEGANFKLRTLPAGTTLVVRKFNVQGTAFSTQTYDCPVEAVDEGQST